MLGLWLASTWRSGTDADSHSAAIWLAFQQQQQQQQLEEERKASWENSISLAAADVAAAIGAQIEGWHSSMTDRSDALNSGETDVDPAQLHVASAPCLAARLGVVFFHLLSSYDLLNSAPVPFPLPLLTEQPAIRRALLAGLIDGGCGGGGKLLSKTSGFSDPQSILNSVVPPMMAPEPQPAELKPDGLELHRASFLQCFAHLARGLGFAVTATGSIAADNDMSRIPLVLQSTSASAPPPEKQTSSLLPLRSDPLCA